MPLCALTAFSAGSLGEMDAIIIYSIFTVLTSNLKRTEATLNNTQRVEKAGKNKFSTLSSLYSWIKIYKFKFSSR